MSRKVLVSFSVRVSKIARCGVAILLALLAVTADAGVVWSGDYSTGDFTQWHTVSDVNEVTFHGMPAYGRPIQYGQQNPIHVGDGSLLSLVSVDGRTVNGIQYPQGPTRGSPFAAKFTVKNSSSGSEPADCDGSVCTRRRTEVHVQIALMRNYEVMQYEQEYWFSTSVFLPSDWTDSDAGWGPIMFQVKEANEASGGLPTITIGTRNGAWTTSHRWIDMERPTVSDIPWQYQMFYAGNEGGSPYPRQNNWPDGLKDFPDVAASHAALQSVNKGGWTDWIWQVRWDARGTSASGPNGEPGEPSEGTGFLTLWKREDDGPWIKVLHVVPKWTTRGGMTFNHGIGYITPGGYGVRQGMYMDKDQVWGNSHDRVLYAANAKVGDKSATFSDMSPDGSSPGEPAEQAPPEPPQVQTVE